MTVQLVPTTNNSFYAQTTTLEGTPYLLSFAYSQREDCWYLSIADSNAVDIYNGIKLICNNPLLFKCKDPRRPPGDFVVISSTTDIDPPGLNDLVPNAGRCQLMYATSDIIALIKNGTIGTYLAQLTAGTSTGTESTYGSM
jgi:hypothetical protein